MEFISSFLHLPSSRARVSLDTQLIGSRVLLRAPAIEDWKFWHALRKMSQDFLMPWEPEWPANALSYGFYSSLLHRQWREWRSGQAFAFTLFLKSDQTAPVLVGGLTLNEIVYAAAQKGTLGYWIGEPYAGRGLMTEAVGLACAFAFDTLKLQRVEAACLPRNEASKAVLRRTGFEEEGYAKAYLQINGKREDHLLWGKSRGRK